MMKHDEISKKQRTVSAATLAIPDEMTKIMDEVKPLMEEKNHHLELAKIATTSMLEDLKIKLLKGELVARGFQTLRRAGSPPQNIPSTEWGLLSFNFEYETPVARGGHNLHYNAVQVGKPSSFFYEFCFNFICSASCYLTFPQLGN